MSATHRDPARRILFEAALIATAVLLYFLVRGLIEERVATAYENAESVVRFEQRTGFFVEPHLQQYVTDHPSLVVFANWMYIYGHWPVVVITLAWLLTRHRTEYRRFRNAMLISGAIGLVIFALFPVAPPRFLPGLGFVDTVTEQSSSYRVLQAPGMTNQYAAVPSLHFGWNLLMGIAWATVATHPLARAFGWIMPPAMFAAIVLTANHYIVDGLLGGSIALFGLWLGTRIDRRNPGLRPGRR
ncbi:PAP2 superfamily protein [Kribbella amoyensis]|uniref:PAP2 superfamily protein n=1 Tax=Kribbella amoyensis TaxID=996641 RepID=A0A561B3M8_9ACTN|nr:phosphatase PAP2 family protein [Kribbella amoyensis]TWD73451.1 PAP2 superfamily protein [Kribbella amoyensis]